LLQAPCRGRGPLAPARRAWPPPCCSRPPLLRQVRRLCPRRGPMLVARPPKRPRVPWDLPGLVAAAGHGGWPQLARRKVAGRTPAGPRVASLLRCRARAPTEPAGARMARSFPRRAAPAQATSSMRRLQLLLHPSWQTKGTLLGSAASLYHCHAMSMMVRRSARTPRAMLGQHHAEWASWVSSAWLHHIQTKVMTMEAAE